MFLKCIKCSHIFIPVKHCWPKISLFLSCSINITLKWIPWRKRRLEMPSDSFLDWFLCLEFIYFIFLYYYFTSWWEMSFNLCPFGQYCVCAMWVCVERNVQIKSFLKSVCSNNTWPPPELRNNEIFQTNLLIFTVPGTLLGVKMIKSKASSKSISTHSHLFIVNKIIRICNRLAFKCC